MEIFLSILMCLFILSGDVLYLRRYFFVGVIKRICKVSWMHVCSELICFCTDRLSTRLCPWGNSGGQRLCGSVVCAYTVAVFLLVNHIHDFV